VSDRQCLVVSQRPEEGHAREVFVEEGEDFVEHFHLPSLGLVSESLPPMGSVIPAQNHEIQVHMVLENEVIFNVIKYNEQVSWNVSLKMKENG
jgi:hypothetical protein